MQARDLQQGLLIDANIYVKRISSFNQAIFNNVEKILISVWGMRCKQLFLRSAGTSQNLGNNKFITLQMRLKVICWMERIVHSTLGFSIQTWFLAVKILDEYLAVTNESPDTLQLIACTALHIASKINQSIIVKIETYCLCSMSIFTSIQLQIYQTQLMTSINWNPSFLTLIKCVKILAQQQSINLPSQYEQFLINIIKKSQYIHFKDLVIICTILSYIRLEAKIPSHEQLLQYLKFQS